MRHAGTIRRGIGAALAAALVAAAAAVPSHAAEEGVTGSLAATLSSAYVFRGTLVTDDPVLQPSLTLSAGDFSFNVWANQNLTDYNTAPGTGPAPGSVDGSGQIVELDYTLGYSFAVEKFSFSVGGIQYTFPHTTLEPTTEIFGTVACDVPLAPKLSLYWDVDEAGGVYANLGVGHTFGFGEVAKGISPSLGLTASVGYASGGWNELYYGVRESGLVDLLLGATVTVPVGKALSLAGFASYSDVLDGTLSDRAKILYGDPDAFFGGVAVSFSF